MRIMLLVGIAWMIHAMDATAAMVFEYNATSGTTVPAPTAQGWTASLPPAGYVVGGVPNDLSLGIEAWKVKTLVATAAPSYVRGIEYGHSLQASLHGWRVKASMRLVGGIGPGLGMYWNGNNYLLSLLLDSSGALRSMHNGVMLPQPLTPSNTGDDAYHDVELRWTPGSQQVEFWFDGALRHEWSGFASGHADAVRFGHMLLAGTAEMNYRNVSFEVGPYVTAPDQAGDYNLDGVVDAADFSLWRNSLGRSVAIYTDADGDGNGVVNKDDYLVWKRNFGKTATAALEASPQPVPEPQWGPLLLATAAGLGWLCCRSPWRAHQG